MAQKRMFSREITDSDSFLDLSLAAQCLYFHVCLAADDEGFISAGKRIARSIGATDKELDELVKSGFLILFPDSGVYVAAHFCVNNTLRSDRFHATVYQTERKQLEKNENNTYQLRKPVDNQLTTNSQPVVTAVKNSIDKNSEEKNSIDEEKLREDSPERRECSTDMNTAMIYMAHQAGIEQEVAPVLKKYGYEIAHDAFVNWKENGSFIGKYTEFVKGE